MLRISQKLDYACRALLYLGQHYEGQNVVRAEEIAQQEGIPLSFLAQILNELKRGELVESRRGKTGGWRLRRSPEELTLLDLVELIEPGSLSWKPEAGGAHAAVTAALWGELGRLLRAELAGRKLSEMRQSGEELDFVI